ncbi:MAG: hypothetical protein J5722_02260 [Oscillospiraceae bacterium]|jgi:hypothetical protein|nr:hypothetical protein [Oscillospiraceae bacterium]
MKKKIPFIAAMVLLAAVCVMQYLGRMRPVDQVLPEVSAVSVRHCNKIILRDTNSPDGSERTAELTDPDEICAFGMATRQTFCRRKYDGGRFFGTAGGNNAAVTFCFSDAPDVVIQTVRSGILSDGHWYETNCGYGDYVRSVLEAHLDV